MYMHVYLSVYVCVFVYICVCEHLSVHVDKSVCVHLSMYVHVCIYECGGVGVCMPQCKCGGHKESVVLSFHCGF